MQDHSPLLLEAEQQLVHLVHSSRENEDFVLDTPFTSEEIDRLTSFVGMYNNMAL